MNPSHLREIAAAQDRTAAELREEMARMIALAGLGTTDGEPRQPGPHWDADEFSLRVLQVIPIKAEAACRSLADAILSLVAPLLERAPGWRPISEAKPDLREALICGGTYYRTMSAFESEGSFKGVARAYREGDEWRVQDEGHDEWIVYQPEFFMPVPPPAASGTTPTRFYTEAEMREAVAAEREACAAIAKTAWLDHDYADLADADVMCRLCEDIAEDRIRARAAYKAEVDRVNRSTYADMDRSRATSDSKGGENV